MKPRQSEDVAFTLVDESVVIVDPRDSRLYWLNGTASRIWQLSDGSRSLDAIAQKLCDEFAVDRTDASRDARSMVDAFCDRGLMASYTGRDGE